MRSPGVSQRRPHLEQAVVHAASISMMDFQSHRLASLGEVCLSSRPRRGRGGARDAPRLISHECTGNGDGRPMPFASSATSPCRATPAYHQAEAYYRQAQTLATELGMRPLVAHCHLGLGPIRHNRPTGAGPCRTGRRHRPVPRHGHDLLAAPGGGGAGAGGGGVMDYDALSSQVIALLQREKRLSYRVLKLRLQLDDEILEDLKEDLIYAKQLAVDEEGKCWCGPGPQVHPWLGGWPRPRGQKPGSHPPPRCSSCEAPHHVPPRHLAERILAEQQALEARGAPDGERKTITALFADIKGSMDLLEDLDPEDARQLIDPALTLMMEAVHRYEGYVAQSLGDGIFALFGAPIAHEDHAQRALYAALRMQEEMRRYADHVRLSARRAAADPRGAEHRGSGGALDSHR